MHLLGLGLGETMEGNREMGKSIFNQYNLFKKISDGLKSIHLSIMFMALAQDMWFLLQTLVRMEVSLHKCTYMHYICASLYIFTCMCLYSYTFACSLSKCRCIFIAVHHNISLLSIGHVAPGLVLATHFIYLLYTYKGRPIGHVALGSVLATLIWNLCYTKQPYTLHCPLKDFTSGWHKEHKTCMHRSFIWSLMKPIICANGLTIYSI